jgi:peptidoglycan hydrolase-like protein with peptidoglycan-binding domain
MPITTNQIAKVAAVLAGAGLVLSSFAIALPAGAQTTTTTTTTSSSVTFARDLTLGSTGADVTALQTWLISKGFSIPAGATGYFGAQTQAAVAAYQAANGITPAAGYFGPITRGRINVPAPVPAPSPSDDDEDEDMNEEDEASDAIDGARDSLSDARDEVEEADDNGDDIGDAEDLLDEAEDTLDDADEAFDDEDFQDAVDLAEEAEDLIDEALDEIDSENDNDDDSEVSSSAVVARVDGADNDSAIFKVEVSLKPFNQDAYVDRDAAVSFEYEIQDSDGNAVTSQTALDASVQSSADRDGDYFVIEEDESEKLTLTVIFDPLAADEGQLYRLQLLGINYADSDTAPDETWDASPESKYRTKYVAIPD